MADLVLWELFGGMVGLAAIVWGAATWMVRKNAHSESVHRHMQNVLQQNADILKHLADVLNHPDDTNFSVKPLHNELLVIKDQLEKIHLELVRLNAD